MIDNIVMTIVIVFTLTIPFSLVTSFTTRPCDNYSYYLPLTFIICKLTESRL